MSIINLNPQSSSANNFVFYGMLTNWGAQAFTDELMVGNYAGPGGPTGAWFRFTQNLDVQGYGEETTTPYSYLSAPNSAITSDSTISSGKPTGGYSVSNAQWWSGSYSNYAPYLNLYMAAQPVSGGISSTLTAAYPLNYNAEAAGGDYNYYNKGGQPERVTVGGWDFGTFTIQDNYQSSKIIYGAAKDTSLSIGNGQLISSTSFSVFSGAGLNTPFIFQPGDNEASDISVDFQQSLYSSNTVGTSEINGTSAIVPIARDEVTSVSIENTNDTSEALLSGYENAWQQMWEQVSSANFSTVNAIGFNGTNTFTATENLNNAVLLAIQQRATEPVLRNINTQLSTTAQPTEWRQRPSPVTSLLVDRISG